MAADSMRSRFGFLCSIFVLAACSSSNAPGSSDGSVESGGSTSSGGTSSGGTSSGGTSSGGMSSGGESTGGTSSGGSSSGGASSGGTSSGATGGTSGSGGTLTDGGHSGGSSTGGVPEAAPPPDSGCAPCRTGLCLDSGVCAECTVDAHCADPTPRCDVTRHACVQCLDDSTCATGTYCDATHVCIPGCKSSGAECASGVCGPDHDCTPCQSDAECAGGKTCSAGQCLAACGGDAGSDAGASCPTADTCCGTRCADLVTDVAHCGACGAACSNSEFCGKAGCSSAIVANICQGTQLTFLTDTLSNDDTDTDTVRTALLAKCVPAPATTVVANDSATTVNATSGEPVTGNVFVVLGGPYRQTLVQYLENHGVTSVYYAF
ncbi:MAG TPA: hypothetical protein VH142_09300, partial [Polyangiaceae bacterium]|nr:hypothetical protein [Polyangiaceae bacterium]